MTAPKRRWFRFSLATLFAVVTLCAIIAAIILDPFNPYLFLLILFTAFVLLGLLIVASFVGLAWVIWWLTPERENPGEHRD